MDSNTLTIQEDSDLSSPYKNSILGDVFFKQTKNYDVSSIKLDNIPKQDQIKILQNIDQVSPQDLLQFSYKVLQKSPWSRKKFDCHILKQTFNNIEFFVKLAMEQGQDVLFNCFQSMQLETFSQKQFVITQGEVGRKFFIILKGQVSILAKISKQRDTEQQQQQQQQQQNNNSNEQLDGGSHAVYTKQKFNKKKPKKIKYHPLWPGVPEDRVKEINVMRQGQCFGELALINDQPRQASVVCLEDCQFAVLTKSEYKQIVSKAQEKKMKQYLDFLSSIPSFQKLSRRGLNMLIFSFQFRNLTIRDYVFKEGDNDGDNIYIIKEGYFKLVKNLPLHKEQVNGDFSYQELNDKCLPCSRKAHRSSEIALLGPGEIFGDYESLQKIKRVVSVFCVSETSELLQISLDELQKKVQILNEEDVFSNIKLQGSCKNKWHNKFLNVSKNISDSFKKLLAYMEISNDKFTQSTRTQIRMPYSCNNSPQSSRKQFNKINDQATFCLTNRDARNLQKKEINNFRVQKKKVIFLDNNNNNVFLTQDEITAANTQQTKDKKNNQAEVGGNQQILSTPQQERIIKKKISFFSPSSTKNSPEKQYDPDLTTPKKNFNQSFIGSFQGQSTATKTFFQTKMGQSFQSNKIADQYIQLNQIISFSEGQNYINKFVEKSPENRNKKASVNNTITEDLNKACPEIPTQANKNEFANRNRSFSQEKSSKILSKKHFNNIINKQVAIRKFKQIDEQFTREMDPINNKFLQIKQNVLDKMMMNSSFQFQQQVQNEDNAKDPYLQGISEYNEKYGINIIDFLSQDQVQKNKEKLLNQQRQVNLQNIFGNTQAFDRIMTENHNKRRASAGCQVHINPKAFLNFVNIN